ncbi:MAG: hypothetical protein NTZ80_01590 [Patescibacteria group bacterium]|nr:hypothetical protein [Patescibacteria group bacterium]
MATNEKKLALLKSAIETAERSLSSARILLNELTGSEAIGATNGGGAAISAAAKKDFNVSDSETEKSIEGVFDGEKMLGPDGRAYPVPHNYASKSKLIPGDLLKLIISRDGRFIYKNIGPIDRKTTIGNLVYEDGIYRVLADGKSYKVLTASVTFFKAQPGDQLAILVPAQYDSSWAAVEALITQPTVMAGNAETSVNQDAPAEKSVKTSATKETKEAKETVKKVQKTEEVPVVSDAKVETPQAVQTETAETPAASAEAATPTEKSNGDYEVAEEEK